MLLAGYKKNMLTDEKFKRGKKIKKIDHSRAKRHTNIGET